MNYLNALILTRKIDELIETGKIVKFCDWVNSNVTDDYLDSPIDEAFLSENFIRNSGEI